MQRRPFSQQRPRIDWFLAASIGLVAILVIFLAVIPGIVVPSVLSRDTILTQRLDPMASSAATIAGLVVDQEASERGYIITADQSFLGPYSESRSRLDALWPVAEAQAKTLGGTAPDLLAAMRRSATAWQTQAAEAEIEDVRSGYQQDAASAVSSGRSQVLFDQFRRDSDAFTSYLAQLRATQTAARDRDLRRLDLVENVLVGLGLLGLGLLVYAGSRYVSLLRSVVLAESEARFRNIVETANEGVWLFDRHSRTLLANQRIAELLNVGLDDLATRPFLDFCFVEDRAEAERHLTHNFQGHSDQFDFRFRRTDGSELLVLACTSPMRDALGSVVGALGMFSDITARKQAEAERNELLGRVQEARVAAEAARERFSLLADASHRLAQAGNDLQAVLDTAARETADALDGGCVLRLYPPREIGSPGDGGGATSAIYHRNASVMARLRPLLDVPPPELDESDAEAAPADGFWQSPAGSYAGQVQEPAMETGGALAWRSEAYGHIWAPVKSGRRNLGRIDVLRLEHGPAYSPDDEALLRELADRTGLAIENARLYRDAVEALRTRDEFLSAITHDLRSPLTSVRGFTQLMSRRLTRREPIDPQRLTGWLATIEKSTDRMAAMLNELLDLAQLRDGRPLNLNPRRVDLVALTRQLADETQQSEERHHLIVDAARGEVVGYWDPVRLSRVLTNLFSNAIKYSPDGGNVLVSVQPCPHDGEGWAEVRVRDEGVGIPPEDLALIFDRFHRGTNVGGIGGLGIGLSAARQIAEQHGGSLSAESEVGKGSVFVLRLPVSGPDMAAEVE